MINKNNAKKATKKSATRALELQEAGGEADLRAWRVAQLAAQLAASSILSPNKYDNIEPDSHPAYPNDTRFDGWFQGLLLRARWLLSESPKVFRSRFEDLFVPSKKYNYSQMAKVFKQADVGSPWHRPDSMANELGKVESFVVKYYAEKIAATYIQPLSKGNAGLVKKRQDYEDAVASVLHVYDRGSLDLRNKILELIPKEFDHQRGRFTEGSWWGRSNNDDGYSCAELFYTDEPFDNFMCYRDAIGLSKKSEEGKKTKGGHMEKKKVSAHSLFAALRRAPLHEDFWSYEPDRF